MSERGNIFMRNLDKWIGVPLVFGIGTMQRTRPMPNRIEKIGIFAFGPIGDFLLSVGTAIPALRMAFPNCSITVFVTSANKAATPLIAEVDEYIELPIKNVLASIRLIRLQSFDVLIDFGPWPRISALLAAFSRSRFSIGFRTPGQFRHYTFDASVPHRNDRHEVENYAAILNRLGIEQMPSRSAISINTVAAHKIAEMGLGRYLVFHPWASGFRKQMREWPDAYWRTLTDEFLTRGYTIVFTGGPSDRTDSARLLSGLGSDTARVIDLAGRLSLQETAALLSRATASVTVNTGIMHLAALLDVRLVALHGPTNPKRWGPVSDHATVLLPDTPDAAYLNLGFEYRDDAKPCMQLISVQDVVEALLACRG